MALPVYLWLCAQGSIQTAIMSETPGDDGTKWRVAKTGDTRQKQGHPWRASIASCRDAAAILDTIPILGELSASLTYVSLM